MRIVPVLVASLAAAAIAVPASASPASAPTVHGVVRVAATTPCASEDAAGPCFWDASTHGNGKGHSFYVVPVGGTTCVFYWGRAYGRTHNYCS